MDASEEKPNRMRKTTKVGIGLTAALLAIPQLRELKEFLLGDQAITNARLEKTMTEGFARLENQLVKHMDDDLIVHRRIRDLGAADLAAAELRCEKTADKIETRLGNLEVFAFKIKPSNFKTN